MVHLLLHYLPWLRAVGQAFAGLAEDGGFARALDQRVLAPNDFFACTAIFRNKKWLVTPIQRIKNNFKKKFRLELTLEQSPATAPKTCWVTASVRFSARFYYRTQGLLSVNSNPRFNLKFGKQLKIFNFEFDFVVTSM